MKPFLTEKLPELQQKCKAFGVKRLFVFGSVVGNNFGPKSDIDFLLAFNENLSIEEYTNNYFLLHDFLENLFGREVDIVTENSLSNPYFIKQLNQSKQLIYES